jgi:adenylate cyclase
MYVDQIILDISMWRELSRQIDLNRECVDYCDEKKLDQWQRIAVAHHAHARALRNPTPENVTAFRVVNELRNGSGSSNSDSSWLGMLAEAMLKAGDVSSAEATLHEAFAFVEQSGKRYWLAELHRLDGRIALQRQAPDPPRAEACFLRAVEIASTQEARSPRSAGAYPRRD